MVIDRLLAKVRRGSSEVDSNDESEDSGPKSVPGSSAALERLREEFARYRTEHLQGTSAAEFRKSLEARIGETDFRSEGYSETELDLQRDLSVTFTWGHDHDFGDFSLRGEMRDRHLRLLANFVTLFPVDIEDFAGKDVLDVGCWTGGTALLLAALGANVVAIEEVQKYAETARYLARSFGVQDRLRVESESLYDCNSDEFHERFDVVHFPGVVYHLSDPVLGLRILYNSLRIGGTILVESAGINVPEPYCRFWGNRPVQGDDKSGWAWFQPSASALERMMKEAGFDDIRSLYSVDVNRVYAYGRKSDHRPICRAGLSVRDIR